MDKENGKLSEKTPKAPKSFMTAGPTLHYSHENVQRCWLLTAAVFAAACLFWSKISAGALFVFHIQDVTDPQFWRLDHYITSGVSIFEYPWQILVLGLLMGIMTIMPILISQLSSFSYSAPFILAVFFLANLPGFAICLLISCAAVACRPLRFRSRFIAIALCTAPQALYWGYFGGILAADPLKWGLSFAPWICAWLIALSIAGVILGVGHFTRYRPGIAWVTIFVYLAAAFVTFQIRIGFDELDYQLYISKNNPEYISEFQDHSITASLDATIANPMVKEYLTAFWYPTDPITLREELKEKIRLQLAFGRWPSWFVVPQELNFEQKKQQLMQWYDSFINRYPASRRMPIVLYYRALLSEYRPDTRMLSKKEVLHFYSGYPQEEKLQVNWYWLYSKFATSPESLEARWRIAKQWAGQEKFNEAEGLIAEAQNMITEMLKSYDREQPQSETIVSMFRPPAQTAITKFKLLELQRRLDELATLISAENRQKTTAKAWRLAQFVMLDPYTEDYPQQLDALMRQTADSDPLYDNILLAQIKLIDDEQLRAEKLAQLHKKFTKTDGGIQGLYELALLKISVWRQQNGSDAASRKKYLAEARGLLGSIIDLYPASAFAEQAKKNLEDLPPLD